MLCFTYASDLEPRSPDFQAPRPTAYYLMFKKHNPVFEDPQKCIYLDLNKCVFI